MTLELILGLFALVLGYGTHLFFRDRREARQHEAKLSVELAAEAKALVEQGKELDEHTRKNLDNFKSTLVTVLENMREIVKSTESERQRTAGVAAATLLRPGKKLPQP